MFPPSPSLTEKNLPSQEGKVFIVTGGASGVGFELSKILYHAGGKVYIAGRSEARALEAIKSIKSLTSQGSTQSTQGQLEFLHLQLDDLSTIKASVEAFKSKESKLDVLWNNAGVSMPPQGSRSAQGHELQLATNCLGHLLFTQLLLPALKSAAQTPSSESASTRVVWTASQMVDMSAPKGGIVMTDLISPPDDKIQNYITSKTGNWFLSSEFAREVSGTGILSVVQNPGNLNTNLLRHAAWLKYAAYPFLYDAKFGAYTELWAGLSPELTIENGGAYVLPWGRLHPSPRGDLLHALKAKEDGGSGVANEFWKWSVDQIADYI